MDEQFVGLDRIEEVFGYDANDKPYVNRSYVEHYWKSEGMPGRRIGSRVLFLRSDLIEWWRTSVQNAIAV